jgi:hypothetical protein
VKCFMGCATCGTAEDPETLMFDHVSCNMKLPADSKKPTKKKTQLQRMQWRGDH